MPKKQIATFLAPNQGLSIVGSHCYAFSGAFGRSSSEQTLLDFNNGSGYIVATLTMTAPINFTSGNIANGSVRGWKLSFNNQTVGLYKADADPEDMPTEIEVQILIPPLTAVVLTCIDSGNDASYLGTANLTGRVYDA